MIQNAELKKHGEGYLIRYSFLNINFKKVDAEIKCTDKTEAMQHFVEINRAYISQNLDQLKIGANYIDLQLPSWVSNCAQLDAHALAMRLKSKIWDLHFLDSDMITPIRDRRKREIISINSKKITVENLKYFNDRVNNIKTSLKHIINILKHINTCS